MSFKIGFIGLGMVGKAIYDVLSETYETCFYDIKIKDSKIEDIMDSAIVFIAVPTIPDKNNRCDLSILNQVMDDLHQLNYKGVICIKSTIIPQTTNQYIEKYNNNKICFCPEFLRERCAYDDFKYNNKICVVGTVNHSVYEIIKTCHKSICQEFRMVHPTEAELTKYFQNVFNTTRILFANAFYEVCKINHVNYDNIINNLLVRNEIDDKYIRCNEKIRGPSGPCLVKDTLAFNEYVKTLDLPYFPSLFQTLVEDMKLYPKTVIEGTRSEQEYFGKEIGRDV
jgi:nucleotide sugar dehydrogenase